MIRLGIVGCGKVVEVFHLPALAQVPALQLTAVMDADQTRARTIAALGGTGVAVAAEMSELAGACDAALVALPNHLHTSTCVALLERRCHVLVEKPMAVDVAGCDRMIDAATRSDAVLGAAMVRRFFPGHLFVRELIAARTYGAVGRISIREGVAYNWPAATGFFLKQAEAGGGVLVDFGSHVLDALAWWLGELQVTAYEDDAAGGVEAECRLDLVSTAGVSIEVELSRLRNLPCTARIEFERAVLELNLRSGAVDLTIGSGRQTVRGQVGVGQSDSWTNGADPFVMQFRQFAGDIASRAGVADTARTARRVAELFESCRRIKQPLRGPASPPVLGVVA
jgi:predicted dehydrogenase